MRTDLQGYGSYTYQCADMDCYYCQIMGREYSPAKTTYELRMESQRVYNESLETVRPVIPVTVTRTHYQFTTTYKVSANVRKARRKVLLEM